MTRIKARNNSLLIVTLHVAFFALGIAMVLIGPLIPILEETLGLNDQQVANFFPVQIAEIGRAHV